MMASYGLMVKVMMGMDAFSLHVLMTFLTLLLQRSMLLSNSMLGAT